MQFRAEAFNVFNRVQLSNPVSALNSPNFGLITSASDRAHHSAGGEIPF